MPIGRYKLALLITGYFLHSFPKTMAGYYPISLLQIRCKNVSEASPSRN
jgi:hypothetical protein